MSDVDRRITAAALRNYQQSLGVNGNLLLLICMPNPFVIVLHLPHSTLTQQASSTHVPKPNRLAARKSALPHPLSTRPITRVILLEGSA